MAQVNVPESIGRELYYTYFQLHKDYLAVDTQSPGYVAKLKEFVKEAEVDHFVVKPNYTISKRGKQNLLGINLTAPQVKKFLADNTGRVFQDKKLFRYLITPFVPHDNEYYISITTQPTYDEIIFSVHGGMDVEDHWHKTNRIQVSVLDMPTEKQLDTLLSDTKDQEKELKDYITSLLQFFRTYGATFLEINPFVPTLDGFVPLDFKMRLDDCEFFSLAKHVNIYQLMSEISDTRSEEEAYIKKLDGMTGASLKMKIINRNGSIWPMIAGGGASIIYFDTLVNMGLGEEIGFYGEYSGNPSTELTYEYANTILKLLLASKAKDKVLIIGGGNANFTDIAKTFQGIIQAITEHMADIRKQKVRILIRRGGPNVEAGFTMFRDLAEKHAIDIKIEGTEYSLVHILRFITQKEKKKIKEKQNIYVKTKERHL